jgi:hypothetical protein
MPHSQHFAAASIEYWSVENPSTNYRFPLERYLGRLLPSFPQKIADGAK